MMDRTKVSVPDNPKIYHILHVDRLPSVIADGFLWSDAAMNERAPVGTTIGMSAIKQRRLRELMLSSHPGLYVGACVPFYFCPRSVMLFMIHRANDPGLGYRGGQGPIIHLETDLQTCVTWAQLNRNRWAFTLSNAGSTYFEDRSDLERLTEIDWEAVKAREWTSRKEGKQAEFLLESRFPWHLVERIGVQSKAIYTQAAHSLAVADHRPKLEIKPDWYY